MTSDPVSKVLHRIPYGFFCVTSRHMNEMNAMVITWITQISFEPRLFGIVVQKTAYSHQLITESGVFLLNIFNRENADLIKPFTKSRKKNPEKLKDVNYTEGPQSGCPILEGAAAYLECKVDSVQDFGGDHDLIVGAVIGGKELIPGEAIDTLLVTDLGWSYAG